VSVDGDRVGIGIGNVVAIYELPSGKLIRSITHAAPVSAVAFSRAGRDLVSGSVDGSLLLTPDGGDSVVLARFSAGIDAVALTADRRLLVAGARGHFSVYDLERNVVLAELESPIRIQSFRLSADGVRLITIPKSGVQATAVLWDLTRYRLITALRGSIGHVFGARFVHDDRDILTATNDGSEH
jgi:WD40 repeat protein